METTTFQQLSKNELVDCATLLHQQLADALEQSESRRLLWQAAETDLETERRKLQALKAMVSVI